MGCTTSSGDASCSTEEMLLAFGEWLGQPAETEESGRVVVVRGRCRPTDPPLRAPLSGKPCLHFGISAKELIWYTHRSGSRVEDRERWEVRFSLVQQSDFFVDRGGRETRVLMRPHEFVFAGSPVTSTVVVTPGKPHPAGVQVTAGDEVFLMTSIQKLFSPVNSEYSMGHWRYEETCFLAEGELSVLGVVGEGGTLEPAHRDSLSPESAPAFSESVWLRWREVLRSPAVIISQRKST